VRITTTCSSCHHGKLCEVYANSASSSTHQTVLS
jgi:hypothetical protein